MDRAGSGFVASALGGGVIKQRIARGGGARLGGLCTIVLFRWGDRAFFVYGCAKSGRENLRWDKLEASVGWAMGIWRLTARASRRRWRLRR